MYGVNDSKWRCEAAMIRTRKKNGWVPSDYRIFRIAQVFLDIRDGAKDRLKSEPPASPGSEGGI